MSITVNRRTMDHVEGESVKSLLKRMKFTFPMVIVKVNGEVVPKSKYTETKVPDDADVEVFHIESGG